MKERFILDLNGVVQEHAFSTFIKYGMTQVLKGQVSPMAFFLMMQKVSKNNGIITPQEQKHIDTFYQEHHHINIPFIPGAIDTVKKMLEKHPVHICSANAYSINVDNAYKEYLTQKIGNFTDIHFVKPFAPKIEYYKQVKKQFPDDIIIVIDDSEKHIKEAEILKLETCYINKYNGNNYKNLAHAYEFNKR